MADWKKTVLGYTVCVISCMISACAMAGPDFGTPEAPSADDISVDPQSSRIILLNATHVPARRSVAKMHAFEYNRHQIGG